MTIKFFFDLEDTVITNFNDPCLCNVERVREFIAQHSITEVTIFSFALWNDKDKKKFDETMRGWLEREFGIKIVAFPSVPEMNSAIFHQTGALLDTHEFITIFGKENGFRAFVKATEGTGTFCLLDDIVEDTAFTRKGKHATQTIITVRV